MVVRAHALAETERSRARGCCNNGARALGVEVEVEVDEGEEQTSDAKSGADHTAFQRVCHMSLNQLLPIVVCHTNAVSSAGGWLAGDQQFKIAPSEQV